jgi:hypothetical protein
MFVNCPYLWFVGVKYAEVVVGNSVTCDVNIEGKARSLIATRTTQSSRENKLHVSLLKLEDILN